MFNGIRNDKEDVTDANKLDDSVGVVTGVAMNESNEGIQGKEKIYEIEEMSLEEGDNIVESLVTSEVAWRQIRWGGMFPIYKNMPDIIVSWYLLLIFFVNLRHDHHPIFLHLLTVLSIFTFL
jgi:hypothetical protein